MCVFFAFLERFTVLCNVIVRLLYAVLDFSLCQIATWKGNLS